MEEKRTSDKKCYVSIRNSFLIGVPLLITMYVILYSIDKRTLTTLVILFLFVIGEFIHHCKQNKKTE